jgi:hypothetical protein
MRGISVVAVENVLRRGILKLTWGLPKKDNRPIPSAPLKRLAVLLEPRRVDEDSLGQFGFKPV